MDNKNIVYLIVRMTMAVSMFAHGAVRVPKMQSFVDNMVAQFQGAALPEGVVRYWAYAVPWIELIIGLLLFVGLLTRLSGIVGSILMLILMFGSGLVENWSAYLSQILHVIMFCLILLFISFNTWSLDKVFKKYNV